MSELPPALPPAPQPPPLNYEPAVPQPKFGIAGWGWACFGVSAVALLLLNRYDPQRKATTDIPAYYFGTILGMLMISIVPALIAFYIGRRSRQAASITFVVVIALALFGQIMPILEHQRKQASQQAWQQYQSEVDEAKAALQEEIRKPEGADPTAISRQVQAMQAASDKTAANLSGEDAAIVRTLAAVVSRMHEKAAVHYKATENLNSKSPLQPHFIKNRQDIAASRQAINDFRQTSASLRSLYAGADEILVLEAAKQKLSPGMVATGKTMITGKLKAATPHFNLIRDLDDSMAAELLKACDLLEKTWGKWAANEREQVTFDDPAAAAQFNAILIAVTTMSDRQTEAQQKYLDTLLGKK